MPGAPHRPLIIGVTGGMASGKSTLARMICGRGILHSDADRIVHRLLHADAAVRAEIGAAFPAAATAQGINRGALAEHIARHPATLAVLEAILHPRVRAEEEARIAHARRNRLRAVVLDVPLLFETDTDALCDVVLAVHAPLSHRRRRAFARTGMTEEKWQRLLDRQLPDAVRNHAADIVILASLGKAAMRRRVAALMQQWGLQ